MPTGDGSRPLVHVRFTLNGRPVQATVRPTAHLLDVLREHLGITSPKRGCETGNCGACTVQVDGEPVRSCLFPAPLVEGRHVLTVEGLAREGRPSPLQEAFYEHYAAQCGFCTSGMLMVSHALLARNPHPSQEEIVEAVASNYCRCTGYLKIIEAVEAASSQEEAAARGN